MPNWLLFAIASLIWGTTWYAIKFQLNGTSPLLSISFRFALAALILFVSLAVGRQRLKYPLRHHAWFALQGVLLFGLCYWFTYLAEIGLTSGLVAVLSSLIIFFNIVFGKLLFGQRMLPKLLLGFLLGIVGMAFLYRDELELAEKATSGWGLLVVAVFSNVFASLGNMVSMRNQQAGLTVSVTNAYGMAYGSLSMMLLALFTEQGLAVDFTPTYALSLVYLAVFGSVIAFYCYLTLLGRQGPGKAAYTTLTVPVIAIFVSTLFEGFTWTWAAFVGLLLVLSGNWVALRKKPVSTPAKWADNEKVSSQ
ncbi:MAG: EamA family transporter [Bacteroidetes bacterium]|nr:EamA family transporter [Bacteroidota bacterium]